MSMNEPRLHAGCIEAVDLVTRQTIYVRVAKIAAFQAVDDDGPTRLVLDTGATIDICGAARTWSLHARIIENEHRSSF